MKTINIKTILKTFLYLQMSALFLTTVVSAEEFSFRGILKGKESFNPPIDGADIKVIGSGKAIVIPASGNLGKLTATWDADITFSIPESPITRTFVAANGDKLVSMGTAAGTPPPNQNVVEEHVIIYGTGQFLGATGGFTVDRWVLHVAPPFTNLQSVGWFEGSIILAD